MSDITISYKGSSIATMDTSGTKTLLTEGKYCEDDIEIVYDKPAGGGGGNVSLTQDANGYLVIDPASPGGGGGASAISIGIQNTDIPNILNMFYALEHGTAATGEYTPASALPNTEEEIFDTGLSTVHGLFVADESQDTLNSGNSPENTLIGIVFNPLYDNASGSDATGYTYALNRHTIKLLNNKDSISTRFTTRGSWRVSGGKFYYTAQFDKNDSYCMFHSGHTYRWVAW